VTRCEWELGRPMTRYQDILRKLAIIDEGFVEDGMFLAVSLDDLPGQP